jgi:subfamily B ATP-binding cassette protein MsbA
MVSAYMVAALLLSPILTLVALGMMALVTLTVQYNIVQAHRIGVAISDTSIELNATAIETMSGIQVIKSFTLEKVFGDKMRERSQIYGDTLYKERKNSSQTTIIQELSVFGMLAAMALVGVSVLHLDFAVIMALLFVLFRMAPRVSAVNLGRQSLAVSLAILGHVKSIMDETSEPSIVSGDRAFTGLKKSIELKDVQFSYGRGVPVLQDMAFTIESGKVTAIAGTSGAGKTTLVDLILRLYDPTEGSILVDGVDLKELDLSSWRRSIGVVSQDVFLFNETVAYNISLGRSDVTQKMIQEAAKQAYADEFIQQWPQGYETNIGDRGLNLSGGQRQRLALARAILLQPEILILDEATSSLDSESEKLIHDYMNEIRGKSTLIVVAHRLSTIRDADQIVVIENGKVAEQGDWDTLVAGSGVFANYYQLQANF